MPEKRGRHCRGVTYHRSSLGPLFSSPSEGTRSSAPERVYAKTDERRRAGEGGTRTDGSVLYLVDDPLERINKVVRRRLLVLPRATTAGRSQRPQHPRLIPPRRPPTVPRASRRCIQGAERTTPSLASARTFLSSFAWFLDRPLPGRPLNRACLASMAANRY